MIIIPKPKNSSKFPHDDVLEELVLKYLQDNKKAYKMRELAEKLDKEFEKVRRALYNLRNADKISFVEFPENKEIHVIYRRYVSKQ